MDDKKFFDTMGSIIDMPLEEFEKELVEQKVNIGTINNLILNLESIYYELRVRKDKILEIAFSDKDNPDIKKALEGLYAEMTKTELKITYLKQKSKELLDVG